MKRNAYLVSVPRSIVIDPEHGAVLAIAEAKGKCRKHFDGCTWDAKRIGHTPKRFVYRVVRLHP